MTEHEIRLPAGEVAPHPEEGSVQFIGTATVLIRCAGFTVLTDPNFIHRHEKVDLGAGLSATRLTDPAVDITDLPPLDLVVLSHFHGDHFDQVAERELSKQLAVVTTPHAAEELDRRGFLNLHPLGTWMSTSVTKGEASLRIVATPGRHGPPVVSFALPEVMGTVLEFRSGESGRAVTLYITGDTLVIDDLAEIPRRHPDIDLALLHLGGTRVMGILLTMDGEQGVEALRMIRPAHAIPIHYDDYDVFKSPLSDFQTSVRAAGLEHVVHYLDRGQTYSFGA